MMVYTVQLELVSKTTAPTVVCYQYFGRGGTAESRAPGRVTAWWLLPGERCPGLLALIPPDAGSWVQCKLSTLRLGFSQHV